MLQKIKCTVPKIVQGTKCDKVIKWIECVNSQVVKGFPLPKLRHFITLNLETESLLARDACAMEHLKAVVLEEVFRNIAYQICPILSSPQGALEMNIDTDTPATKTISISLAFCLLLPEEESVKVN